MFRIFSDLTKFGIVIFVLLTGLAGYLQGFVVENVFDFEHFIKFMGGLYFLSSGSLALNQVQEWRLDQKMNRTAKRPIASGKIKPLAGAILALSFIAIGSDLLLKTNFLSFVLGWVTLILYNGFYTLWWKKKWSYAAIPGAIPGALPALMGFVAQTGNIWVKEGWYLFLILFLWQMPHFWLLAIRYQNDYKAGDVPTLPVTLGFEATWLQIRLYTLSYIGVAVGSPWFLEARWAYIVLTIPVSILGFLLMQKYHRDNSKRNWFWFFMWANLSILVYLFAPAIDRWQLIMSAFRLN
jgi:protoheme IX farnesyltransferase